MKPGDLVRYFVDFGDQGVYDVLVCNYAVYSDHVTSFDDCVDVLIDNGVCTVALDDLEIVDEGR